jgi:hypothetical protein
MARERGVLRLWPDSSSKTSQAPRSAAVPYLRPGLLPPGGDLLLIPLGRAPGGDLHAPSHAVQQQVQPGQGVGHAEPLAHHVGDAGQRPALVVPLSGRLVLTWEQRPE